jgi:hypothetical protein
VKVLITHFLQPSAVSSVLGLNIQLSSTLRTLSPCQFGGYLSAADEESRVLKQGVFGLSAPENSGSTLLGGGCKTSATRHGVTLRTTLIFFP